MGIADGFGVAEDPKGLDRTELLRLVAESRPVTSFNKVRTYYISTYIYANMFTCVHTLAYVYTWSHIYVGAYFLKCMRTHVHAYIHTCTHKCVHKCVLVE